MVSTPEHPASGRLALLGLCGDLVVAFEAERIFQIHRAAETISRTINRNLYLVDIGGTMIPGWDLGELLGLPPCTDAWVVVDVARLKRRFAFRLGRCISVQQLPVCYEIPRLIFTARPGAIAAGFSAAAIPELEGYPSGVVIDPACILLAPELEAADKLRKEGLETTVEA